MYPGAVVSLLTDERASHPVRGTLLKAEILQLIHAPPFRVINQMHGGVIA